MGRREGFLTRADLRVPDRPSPNAQMPVVGAELRVFWPGNATRDDVADVLLRAYQQALTRLEEYPFTAEEWQEWRAQRG